MSEAASKFSYRPEIDGLRAIAVVAVVMFHAGLGVPGGFVGVDVFYVISGYLITSLILKELENKEFSLSGFWERRIKRIVPAMVVMIFTTLVVGWFLLLPDDYARLGKSVIWQVFFAANVNFWMGTGYFAGPSNEIPLLHTWSLAVEEQYYLLVPLLLMALYKIDLSHHRRVILVFFLLGMVLSLMLSVYAVRNHPSAAFYLLPSRAWELVLGGIIAVLPSTVSPSGSFARNLYTVAGMAGVVIPCWLYTKETPFPGMAAIFPCVGTAVFIWASRLTDSAPKLPVLAYLITLRPIVFVGLISYSLYLWHWPVLVYSNYWLLDDRSLEYTLLLVGLSFFLSILSWKYIEKPFRKKTYFANRRVVYAYGGGSSLILLIMGLLIAGNQGIATRFSPAVIADAEAKSDRIGVHELKAVDVENDRLPVLGNTKLSQPSVLLWGDSHAMASALAFDELLKEKGLKGVQATASATAPVVQGYWENDFTNRQEVKAFNSAVIAYVKRHKIQNVILVAYWEYYSASRSATTINDALVNTVKKLRELGAQPWIMLQVPHPEFDVPKGLAMSHLFGVDLNSRLTLSSDWIGLGDGGLATLNSMRGAGVKIINPLPCFLNESTSALTVELNGEPLFRDEHHLSSSGAKVLASCIRSQMSELL
ncbi:acyltransferase [Mariprofundus erugo]|uniref:acyltransferase family protein n=1 Tax=Mariprofundus erugo TaxID=2528639 RepID=UPI0010FD9497|nr:acyltransferase family protein [Mariprofundus erugo]TLS78407.1 acyltransferase [Mariprofundus erugo]